MSAELPKEAVEASAKAIETRCCSFGEGDGSNSGFAEREYRRVAREILQAAAPFIRKQRDEELRERLREKLNGLQLEGRFSEQTRWAILGIFEDPTQ